MMRPSARLSLLGAIAGLAGGLDFTGFERSMAKSILDRSKSHCADCGKRLAHAGKPGRTCPECRAKPPAPNGPGIILVDLSAERATVQ